jgi:uncharacterized membrane protein
MKKWAILMLVSLFLGNIVYGLNDNFEIDDYHIDILVNDDNTYDIVETIQVEFFIDRRGIIRNIPLQASNDRMVRISNISVNHPFETSVEGGHKLIKIGDPDKYAMKNTTYKISYTYEKGDDFNEAMDEFYFNLIGLDWDVAINKISFDIKMPHNFDEGRLNFTYGSSGSKNSDGVIYQINGSRISGSLPVGLGPNQALTIALPLEEGYYGSAEPLSSGLISMVSTYRYMLFPLLIVLAFLIRMTLGKNKIIYPTVEFYPPKAITPADVGIIVDGSADPQDVTSLIIYWADQGYIEIIETPHPKKKNRTLLSLKKLKDLEGTAYENEMFNILFLGRDFVELSSLKKTFYITIQSVQRQLKDMWLNQKSTRVYSKKTFWVRLLIQLFAYASIGLGFLALLELSGTLVTVEFVPLAVIVSILWHVPVKRMIQTIIDFKRLLPKLKFKIFMKSFFGFLISVGAVLGYGYYVGDLILAGLMVIASIIITIFSSSCLLRTPKGNKYLESILGFKTFVELAELDRIKMLIEEDPMYFFHVLPYAIVFNLTDLWAKKFESITLTPPTWFKRDGNRNIYSSYMYGQILSNTSQEVASFMKYAPRATSGGGSSSGGSAGGGDGGGGGSDW